MNTLTRSLTAAAGRAKSFAAAPDQWPLMALKVDSKRRIVLATEVALDGFTSAAKEDWGRSAILQFDLHSGKLLHRIAGPPNAALGDMALTRHGDALVSDGEHGGLYRIDRARLAVKRIDSGEFISPQTPAALADGKHVLVPAPLAQQGQPAERLMGDQRGSRDSGDSSTTRLQRIVPAKGRTPSTKWISTRPGSSTSIIRCAAALPASKARTAILVFMDLAADLLIPSIAASP